MYAVTHEVITGRAQIQLNLVDSLGGRGNRLLIFPFKRLDSRDLRARAYGGL